MRLLHSGMNHIVTSRLVLLPLAVWAGACAPGPRGTSTAPAPAAAPVRVESLPPVTLEYPSSGGGVATSATSNLDEFAWLDHMDWPGPNSYRGADGAPGPAYWQQRANYDIRATLDTGARRIQGHVTITYTNNSPDTLRYVWLQLDQNLYRTGSRGSALYPQDSRWGVRGFQGGYEITDLLVNGKSAASRVNDTMMQVTLDAPLAPRGASTTLAMDFTFRIPDHGSDRMGRDGTLYEIAQWYPRMAVYDDVRGWNTDPYLGQGEFYLEYGDIDYAVTVPAGYTVAGSGVLENPGDVLTGVERSRLARAATSTAVVPVIGTSDATATPVAGMKTWRFRAHNVRDVAWAGAPDFRWDATSWNGVVIQAFYQWPKAGAGWENAAENTQWTIRTYSTLFFPYPYPQASTVAGPVGGMEYPMFVMVGYAAQPQGAFDTIDHEQGHEWFPMMVGSNERRYAWMDEGINTYINTFSNELRKPGTSRWSGYLEEWRAVVENGTQSPLMTMPDLINPGALGAIGYRKPAAVLLTLRDHVVGREAFDRAFREYIRRWAFRHPTPADFFRTIESYTGQDLSWFWRGFFYGTGVLDIGIDSVSSAAVNGDYRAMVTLSKHSDIPFPVELRLKLADGSTQDARLPALIWKDGDRYVAAIPVRGAVVGARLWPDPTVPDWNDANDAWGDAPPAEPAGPVTSGGLTSLVNGGR
ncbi:MAG TPA: M1 family metallopeptidase [Gemmatimonadaceae bacterium]|nr:M1 family metallopeptidase [Gemmatimonadaceae bacterium]